MYKKLTLKQTMEYTVNGRGCWIWKLSKNSDGYGRTKAGFRQGIPEGVAHRIAWYLKHGPIPKGICVCHKCDNTSCINPEHLFLGTHKQNMEDKARKKRHNNQKKTSCKRGHEFTPENTLVCRGSRYCRTCKRARYKRKCVKSNTIDELILTS